MCNFQISDLETTPKEVPTITTGTQTTPVQSNVNQTIQQVVGGLTESGLKSPKQTVGTVCNNPSSPSCIKPDLSVSNTLNRPVRNQILVPPDVARNASLNCESNLIPAHHLVINEEDNKNKSCKFKICSYACHRYFFLETICNLWQ